MPDATEFDGNNPFAEHTDEELETLLTESPGEADKEASEEKTEEKDDLFDKPDDEDDPFSEEEDEEEGDEKAVVSKATFQKRLNKVIQQREDVREELTDALAENARLHEMNATVLDKYKEFKDPSSQSRSTRSSRLSST